MNRCLEPTYAFRNFESFSQCFHSWSNATSDSSEAVLEIESDFGKIIQGCLQNYCNSTNSDLGSCGLNLQWDRFYRLTLRPFVDFNSHACHNLNDHVNTDIAGPGVIISYVMQIAIISCIWLAIRILGLIDSKKARERNSRMRMYLINQRSVVRFFLVEFQETQCFFVIAIQIAFILSMSAGPELYGAASLYQLGMDIAMTRAVCIGSLVSVNFGLWLVQKASIKSFYTLLCSSITVFLSIVTFHMASHWSPTPDKVALLEDNDALSKCGYHPPPLIWCGPSTYFLQDMLVFGLFVATVSLFCFTFCHALLELLQVGSLARRHLRDANSNWLQNVYHCINGLLPSSRRTRSNWKNMFKVLNFCVEAGLFIMGIWSTFIITDAVNLDASDWNFGQIIAVSIWAPPMFKYLYWSLFGVESYSAARIPLPYKITNTNPNSSE